VLGRSATAKKKCIVRYPIVLTNQIDTNEVKEHIYFTGNISSINLLHVSACKRAIIRRDSTKLHKGRPFNFHSLHVTSFITPKSILIL
jgi:hypothetical protein